MNFIYKRRFFPWLCAFVYNDLNAKVFLVIIFLSFPLLSYSQVKCGTTSYNNFLIQQKLILEGEAQFERWLEEKKIKQKDLSQARKQVTSYKIQVVVHVIHNGEQIGLGGNISDAQIKSQISVLNEDFQRKNADAINTPVEFAPMAGALPIEFVLASTDPFGNPTSGINRVKGSKPDWNAIEDNEELKALSYWPSENYINIWVCLLSDRYGIAQFPISTLPGLENISKSRLTDGIVISYEVFGSIDFGNFDLHPVYNKGRTTTHEMGHYLGLRHLWGDKNDCSGTDYIEDTPPQANQTDDCPQGQVKECPLENPQSKMYQNYMDYTDDQCLNLFTVDQTERMRIVLENSPRRASLLSAFEPLSDDFTFPEIISPNGDGINDYWLWPNTLTYEGCKLIIFNKYGKAVYETISYDNTWDGRTNSGQPLEEEAYFYKLQCAGKQELTGGVRIIR